MNNFNLHIPTDIHFGKDQISCLPSELAKFGKNILMVYGGGSIKRTGLYDKIRNQLKDFHVEELPGITPNPKISAVRRGVEICRTQKIDLVLAVGGGSCIDASKAIACGNFYDGDPWDLVLDNSKVTEALPIAVVLTINATGSESNNCAVISNEETNEKLEIDSNAIVPKFSILDPTYLYTLPARQTAAGTADILSHVFEQYFQPNDGAYLSDRVCESVIKTCIKYCPVALKDPENYEARSNLMWSSTLGLNHILSAGKGGSWSCHPIEHELSAYYDITHGVGLAIITPPWMHYVLNDDTVDRFAMYAKNVWGIEEEDPYKAANAGIDATADFLKKIGMPSTLKEVGIDREKFREMAEEAVRTSRISTGAYVHLNAEDVVRIFEACAG